MIFFNHFRIILNSVRMIVVDFTGFVEITKILTRKTKVMDLLNSKNFENYSS